MKAINHLENIRDIQSYVYNGSHLLNINNIDLTVLSRDTFAYQTNEPLCDQIESIYVVYNNINQVSEGCLDAFVNLRNINFGVNLLETIKRNYFHSIRKIEFLNFQSNLIETIEIRAFDDLHLLEYIYLDDNCLTRIPDYLFHRTLRIRNIFLQRNHLEYLSSNFMRPSQKLSTASILTTIVFGTLQIYFISRV